MSIGTAVEQACFLFGQDLELLGNSRFLGALGGTLNRDPFSFCGVL